MDKVFVIYECSGDYEMYSETPIGFTTLEDEAKSYVDKRNAYNDILEETMNTENRFEFLDAITEWDYIAEGIIEKFQNENEVPGFNKTEDRVINPKEYIKWVNEVENPMIENERVKYFENNPDAQKYLPEGKTWKEYLKMYDDYEDYTQYYYDYKYEVVNKLKE